MDTDKEVLRLVGRKIAEAMELLTRDLPDMEVTEWNHSNTGMAVRRLMEATEAIAELDQ